MHLHFTVVYLVHAKRFLFINWIGAIERAGVTSTDVQEVFFGNVISGNLGQVRYRLIGKRYVLQLILRHLRLLPVKRR